MHFSVVMSVARGLQYPIFVTDSGTNYILIYFILKKILMRIFAG